MKALAWKSACVQAIAMCQGEFARFGCPQLAAGAVYPGSPVGDTAVPPTHRCLETAGGQQRVSCAMLTSHEARTRGTVLGRGGQRRR